MALNKWDKQHLINLGLTQRQIDSIFTAAVKEAAAIGVSIDDFNPDKPFSFADYPETKARIEKLVKSLQNNIEVVTVNSARSGWTLANNKNNALCDRVFGENKYKLTKAQERKYYNNNDKALEAFIKRKTAGLNLSDRVWNYTDQFKDEIEMGMDLCIRNGLPAAEMARDLKKYLKEPDKLFRRVRDEYGELKLSKAAKAYNPGAGHYRSSYKNAMRLARTENNIAYRTSDHERWQQLDFVVGIEIRLSNNHTLNGEPFTDICDQLQGKYPKDFKFTGWHPQCRCHAISILKTQEEMMKDNERIMNGEESSAESENSVKDVPEKFKTWIADNNDRIEAANNRGTLPYFLKDNATLSGVSTYKINIVGRAEILKKSLLKYNSYDSQTWEKVYFDKFSGGFNVYHKKHNFAKKGGGGNAEMIVGKMLAKNNGKQVEFLKESSFRKSPDIKFDSKTWDIKLINNANEETIRNYIKDARKAENAIFYWDKNDKLEDLKSAVTRSIGYFKSQSKLDSMPDIYYMSKDGILKSIFVK